jgi:DNA (cytosine-5)-methyltransferase 1
MIKDKIYTIKTHPITTPPIILRDVLEKNVDEKYYLDHKDSEKWKYMKGAKRVERTSKAGYKYCFSEGAIAFPDNLDAPARTMLTSEAKKNRSTHVIKDPGTNRLRVLTPVECERIDSFPDNWTNTDMPESFRYFCMGNALVVGLITKMGKELKEIYKKENSS